MQKLVDPIPLPTGGQEIAAAAPKSATGLSGDAAIAAGLEPPPAAPEDRFLKPRKKVGKGGTRLSSTSVIKRVEAEKVAREEGDIPL